jgi:flagellar M-ring protein FliF
MGGLIAQLRGLGMLRLAALAGIGLAVLGLVTVLAMRASEPPMALLYGDLDPRDAGQMVAALERARIPHRLAAGGAQLLVPESEVPRIRLMLAREGMPSGGSIGYEIFDRGESLTTTPFQQDVNRLRALEGELSRSIRTLSGVRTARVHLVLQRREPFSRERGEAQASVVLTMQGAQRLDREGVQAVLHLVAAAVPGLRPQQVSIVDSRGELLARGGQALTGPAAAQTGEEMRRTQELRLARAVEDLLERTLGAGRVRAEASVEMDFDRVQTTEERFDPENQVPRSTQSSTESNRSGEAGNVTVANQLPGAQAQNGGNRSEQQRQEETTNFEIGRTTRNTLREQPSLRRVSLAVLVDGVWEPQPDGAPPRFRERNADEIGRIMALARSAIGFNEQRGDKVEVVSLRFAEPPIAEATSEGFSILGQALPPAMLGRLVESGILALVALAAILLIGKPVANRLVLAMTPQPVLVGVGPDGNTVTFATAAEAAMAQANGTITGAAQVAGPDGTPLLAQEGGEGGADEQMIKLSKVDGEMRASALAALVELVEKNPDAAVTVVRRWLAPPEDL